MEAAKRCGVQLEDRQLAAAPRNRPEGETYLKSMSAAANFAFASRQLVSHFVRWVFFGGIRFQGASFRGAL